MQQKINKAGTVSLKKDHPITIIALIQQATNYNTWIYTYEQILI